MIIGISGRKRHGKDSVGHVLESVGFRLTAFADPVKRVAMDVYALSWKQCYGEEIEKETVDPRWGLSPREIMQRIGTEVGRSIHSETWIKRGLWGVQAAMEGEPYQYKLGDRFEVRTEAHQDWAITDVRFPNEAAAIREAGGIILKVLRPSLAIPPREHLSESSVDLVQADGVIVNDGSLRDLRENTLGCLRALGF